MYLTTALLTSLFPHLSSPLHLSTLTPTLPPSLPHSHCYYLAPHPPHSHPTSPLFLSLSPPHPLLESWLEVSQQGVEGALGHSHSQEELEQLLAAAVSDEELSDSDFT